MKRLILLSLLAMATMSSCSRYLLTQSKVLNNHDLTSYKTFTIQRVDGDKLPEKVDINDAKNLYKVVAEQLVARGYKFVKSGDADMIMYLSMKTKKSLESDTNTTGNAYGDGLGGYGYGGFNSFGARGYRHAFYDSSSSTSTYVVTDAMMMLDLVESGSNSHIFCSQIKTRLKENSIILKDNAEVAKVAEKLFKKFPVELPKK